MNDQTLHKDNVNNEPTLVVLRRSQIEKRSVISDDYVVYLQELEFDLEIDNDSVSFIQTKEFY